MTFVRRASVILAATLAVGGLVLLGGCGSAESDGGKIDLSEQFKSVPKKDLGPIPDSSLSARDRRAKRLAAARGE
jgi:hypothetical protein